MRHELLHQGHRATVLAGVIGPSIGLSGVRLLMRGRLEMATRWLARRRAAPEQELFQCASVFNRAISPVHHHGPFDIVNMEESFGWFSEVKQQTSIPVVETVRR